MNWQEILKYFISVTVITGTIGFISKTLFSKFIDAGIEKYKAALNKDLELYKSDLERINTEHQIRYSKLYEKRGKKIKKLYQLIYELENKLKFLTSAFQGQDWTADTERSDAVENHLFVLEKTLELNRIYFAEELSQRIGNIIFQSRQIMGAMYKAKLIQKHNDELFEHHQGHRIDNPNAPLDTWLEAESFVQTEIKKARLDLVKEFHELIGVN
jgi:hypothetical protein